MNGMRSLLVLGAAVLLGGAEPHRHHVHQDAATTTEKRTLPGTSLYQLRAALRAEDGSTVGLDVHRGAPVFVSMFYGTCPHACPAIIASLKRIEAKLDPETRARARFLLVSFDAERDDPVMLRGLMESHKLDRARWRMAAADARAAQEIAAVLGVRFKKHPDGSFTHTSVITLLDGDGVPVAATEDMAGAAEEMVPKAVAIPRG
ncbi:MAG: SCO family protein [Myxococcota bacterium]